MEDTSIATLVRRYAEIWNEPDPAARSAAVADLWAEDGVEWTGSSVHRGHAEIEDRVRDAYEQFVRDGGHRFVLAGDVAGGVDTDGGLTFTTHMVPAAGGVPVWTGTVFLVLDDEGRIRSDHQFARDTPPDARTRAVAEEFLRRFGAGDVDGLAELFADDVDWLIDWPAEGHPDVPWIRPRRTRADMADLFRELIDTHVPDRGVSAPTVLVDGHDAVVLAEVRQTVRATGVHYTMLFALRLTVEDGLITAYHVYEDSLSIANALSARD
ncbi:MAG: nuclear transport factor 2 family protein [Pseudonocardia sp.]